MDVNAYLQRKLKPRSVFQDLIPKSEGKKTFSGTGETDFSMDEIANMIELYSWQLKKVANKIKKSTLKQNVDAIKDFCYSYFQYKADESDQFLRSPSYAWHIDRESGIDCKSYSIIAGCLLAQMGISFYIRRIKQPGFAPDQWTHVYVVVPINQETENLDEGYYTIDGTLLENTEPLFIEKDDLQMSLKHYRLNGPAGLGFSIGNIKLENLKDISNLIKNIGCLGGTTYDEAFMKKILAAMDVYFNNLVLRINQAVVNGDETEFASAINEFYAVTKLGVTASEKKLAQGWNPCSSNVIKIIIQAWKFYRDVAGKALTAWLNDNFVKDTTVTPINKEYNSTDLYSKYGMGATLSGLKQLEPIYYYDPKPKKIPVFELTKYVQDLTPTSSFDALQFISSLSSVLANFEAGQSTNNPIDDNSTINSNGSSGQSSTLMGFGTVGWIVALAGLGLMIRGFAKTPSKRTLKTAK